jgi:acyl dehydratase
VRVGETLTAQATVESVRTRGDVAFLTLRTDVRDESGRGVVVARSTLVVRAAA